MTSAIVPKVVSQTTPINYFHPLFKLITAVSCLAVVLYNLYQGYRYNFATERTWTPLQSSIAKMALLAKAKNGYPQTREILQKWDTQNVSDYPLAICIEAAPLYISINPQRAFELAQKTHQIHTMLNIVEKIEKETQFNCLEFYQTIFQECMKDDQQYIVSATVTWTIRCVHAFYRLKKEDLVQEGLQYIDSKISTLTNAFNLNCQLARACHDMSLETGAEIYYNKAAAALDNKSPIDLLTLAETCCHRKQNHLISEHLEKIKTLSTETSILPYAERLASLLLKIANTPEEAQQMLKNEFNLEPKDDPQSVETAYRLAKVYRLLGQKPTSLLCAILRLKTQAPETLANWWITYARLSPNDRAPSIATATNLYNKLPAGQKKREIGCDILRLYNNSTNLVPQSNDFFKNYLAEIQNDTALDARTKITIFDRLVKTSEDAFTLEQKIALLEAAEKLIWSLPAQPQIAYLPSLAERYLQIGAADNLTQLANHPSYAKGRQHLAIAAVFAAILPISYYFPVARVCSLMGTVICELSSTPYKY
jgi:hypothetical protein